MTFGLNRVEYSHVVRYPTFFSVYFRSDNKYVHADIHPNTDEKYVLNLLWALDLPLETKDVALTIFTSVPYGKRIWAFLHYHKELKDRPYSFLHLPGTLNDGRVFDKGTNSYVAYTEKNGSLIYIDPITEKRSIVSRTAEYMKTLHIKAQGKIQVNN